MPIRKRLVIVVCCASLSFEWAAHVQRVSALSPAQTKSDAPAPAKKALTTDEVVAMLQGGLSEDLVIARIQKAGHAFDLSADEMLRLKKLGVSDRLLMVMMDPATPVAAPLVAPGRVVTPGFAPVVVGGANPSGATPAVGSVVTEAAMNDPNGPHDSGIYLHTLDRDGNKKMIALERAAYQGGKSGGRLLSHMTYGLKKEKWKAVIPGERASIRAPEPRPIFYFYFEDKSAALGKSQFGGQTVSNPNQFSLVQLEVKKTSRETIIGEQGSLGSSSGTHAKSMRAFKTEKLKPGVYRVTPIDNLEPGEYCFFAAGASLYGTGSTGAAAAVDIFDFGVSSAE